ncbi:catalase [Pseudorhodoferax aquiterrae]|uniref:Catalase n=1 Tax=Pseudorhodoferax aquiterrae TaxID=747304 RepID=A0ABQ3GDK9_9BURK|nr:catalase [Pseudorhodoferax aquiterrae]GHD02654.1 catalase [Pseudorhodoferax aquiterrae]
MARKDAAGAKAPRAGTSPKQQQMQTFAAAEATAATGLTTNQGLRLSDNHNSLKAGVRGPTLLEDFILREKITHFDHERIPERVVHARGAGAHGYFQLYRSLATYTRAAFLQDPEQRTPVFVRFSTVAGSRGSADTVRDVRGFAVKFYTSEGNYDLVGNNMPVFFVQDAMKFPDLIHAVKPEPHHEMPQAASAHDTFWDFASLMPETTHMLMWAMSDRAIPRSYRMMEGFGVHTFRLVNAGGDAVFVKFHWKPKLGVHGLAWDEAQKIAGTDPDFHRRDLWEAIERGEFPEWELGLQIIDEGKADQLGFDILDPTKLVPEEMVPVQRVGKLVLDRNPDNFFAETEQVAFHPGHIVPGIDFSNDPLLQGRLFSYTDTQLSRLGGPNFHEIPINRGVCPFHNFQRDGMHRMAVHRGRAAYEPNTLGQAGTEFRVDGGPQGFQEFQAATGTPRIRQRSPSFDDHFSQAALFWHSQGPAEKEHIVAAFRFELGKVEHPEVRQRMVDNLAHVDAMLARKVASGLGLTPDPRAAAGRAGFREVRGKLPIEESAALRMASQPPSGSHPLATRKVAVLVADGVEVQGLRPVLQALQEAGAHCLVLAPQLSPVATEGGRQFAVDHALTTMPSVLFDAVLVAGGERAAQALDGLGAAHHFVLQAYKHAKAVCVLGQGAALLRWLGLDARADAQALARHPGVVIGPGGAERAPETAKAFIDAIARHRHWDRPLADGVPA